MSEAAVLVGEQHVAGAEVEGGGLRAGDDLVDQETGAAIPASALERAQVRSNESQVVKEFACDAYRVTAESA